MPDATGTLAPMALVVGDREVRPLTAHEVMRMVELDVLGEDEPVELLHGVLTAVSLASASLTVIGTPCSGPSSAPDATAAWAASAARRAPSGSTSTTAPRSRSSRSIRSSCRSTSARLDTSRRRIIAATSTAGRKGRSSTARYCPKRRGQSPAVR